jgi:hypothetical protein
MKREKMCFCVAALLLMSTLSLSAQGPDTIWTRAYGGSHDDCCYSVIESSTGGYVLAGWTYSFGAGQKDVYLLKVDVNGDTMWTRTFGGSENEEGRDVKETYDGGFIVAGWTESFGSGGSDVYLVKTDANGNEQWTASYGLLYDEYASAVQQTPDSGYIIAGRFNSFGYGGYDIFVVKFDTGGNPAWASFIGDSLWNVGNSMLQTADGGYVIAGSTMQSALTLNMYLVKIDSVGDAVWQTSFGGTSWEVGDEVKQTLDGGFIVAGTALTGSASSQLFLVKSDSAGNLEWSRRHGDNGWDEGHAVEVLSDGGYLLVGESESATGDGFDVYLSRTFPDGNSFWAKRFGGSNHDYGYSAKVTLDGGYIIAGKTKSYGNGLHDIYLVKMEADLGIDEFPCHNPSIAVLNVTPNPFATSTAIHLTGIVHGEERKELNIYDISGRRVRDFILYPSSFILDVTWDGRDENGCLLPSGVYYVRLKGNGISLTKKVMKIR